MKKKRVLFLTTVFPYPLDNGGKIRAFNNLKTISEEFTVDLVCFSEEEVNEACILEFKKYCSNIKVINKVFQNSTSKINTIKNIFKGLVKNSPLIIEKFIDRRFIKEIKSLREKYSYHAVFFEHLSISSYINLFDDNEKLVLSQQNCEFMLMKRRYNESKMLLKKLYIYTEYAKLKKYELDICSKFDEVIMLSEADKKCLLDEGYNKENIKIIPIGVDRDLYRKKHYNEGNIRNILFTGTMSWYPNQQGILWFIDNVWDKLREKNNNLNLYVVGKGASEEIVRKNNTNGIIVTGYVDDINEYIEKCDICIVPLFIGGGMRVKILEAMAKGIPCISSDIGAEGIDVTNNEDILIANNVEEFIDCTCKLNNKELYNTIVKESLNLIENKYSTEVIKKNINECLRK